MEKKVHAIAQIETSGSLGRNVFGYNSKSRLFVGCFLWIFWCTPMKKGSMRTSSSKERLFRSIKRVAFVFLLTSLLDSGTRLKILVTCLLYSFYIPTCYHVTLIITYSVPDLHLFFPWKIKSIEKSSSSLTMSPLNLKSHYHGNERPFVTVHIW